MLTSEDTVEFDDLLANELEEEVACIVSVGESVLKESCVKDGVIVFLADPEYVDDASRDCVEMNDIEEKNDGDRV